jgi:hypothetical protein
MSGNRFGCVLGFVVSLAAQMAARLPSGIWAAELPRCSGDVRGDDVGGVPV